MQISFKYSRGADGLYIALVHEYSFPGQTLHGGGDGHRVMDTRVIVTWIQDTLFQMASMLYKLASVYYSMVLCFTLKVMNYDLIVF